VTLRYTSAKDTKDEVNGHFIPSFHACQVPPTEGTPLKIMSTPYSDMCPVKWKGVGEVYRT